MAQRAIQINRRMQRDTKKGKRSMTGTRKPQHGKSGEARAGQSRRFIEAARQLGADQSEEAFNESLRRVAKAAAPSRDGRRSKAKKAGSE